MKQESLLPFKLSESKRFKSKTTAFGGLPLILETYRTLGLDRVVSKHLHLKDRGWEENDILEELITLQVAGGDCMDDVEYLKVDDAKILSGHENLPGSSAVGRFLHRFDEGVSESRGLGWAYIPEENDFLKGLNEVNRHLIRKFIEKENPSFITLDVDATVAKTYKRDALETYKGGRGYQPMQAIWAEKQLIMRDQFRDGNVNAAASALNFLKQCEENLPRQKNNKRIKLRIRSDGAWYQHDIMGYCVRRGYEFSISADVSYGLKRFVMALPEEDWKPLYQITKDGAVKTDKEYALLRFTTASLSQAGIRERIHKYRYIITRTPNSQYHLFEGPYIYEAIVTNMDWDIQRQIWWHFERCGTIEHVIDILKNDLGGGKFPCGTFGANAAWWRITCITHNLIQALKIIALPFSWFYTRMKRLRFRLFCVAGRIIKHARQIFLQLARGHPILPIYRQARVKLAAFAI